MPLFERIAGQMVLSDAGRVMVPYAERAVAAAQDAENAVRALARPDAGQVTLAVVGTLATHKLARIIYAMLKSKTPYKDPLTTSKRKYKSASSIT